MQSSRFIEQLRRNSVALISLAIAIASLSYNSWRNELSEDNRTQRTVSIEVLRNLSDLQELVWHNHYDRDTQDKGNLRSGWAIVITTRDIATILNAPLPESAAMLYDTWSKNNEELGKDDAAKDAIIEAIEKCRSNTLNLLQELR
ncbi:MAG: hypothetical protein O2907_00035 [Proteobacteria bacterium]|nr:hypothetical protein [Pseudomonadota bacterium]MDA1062723.1 hypothetical protein [Pseudomonadota bacterium]